MSENRFDPRKFAQFKIKSAEALKGVLKADKSVKAKPSPQPAVKQTEVEQRSPMTVKPRKFFIMEVIIAACIALIIAMTIRAFVVQVIYVPTSAMEPSIRIGDRLVVNKLVFGFVGNNKPQRGQIVAVYVPGKSGYLVKRVIGLPGEKIKIRGGQVYINGKALRERYPLKRGNIDLEQTQIGRGLYYILGDNRDRSEDSRTFGAVPLTRMIGPVIFRIWPLKHFTSFR